MLIPLLACNRPIEPSPTLVPPVPAAHRPPGVVVLPTAPWAPATPWPTFTPLPTPWPTVAYVDFDPDPDLSPTLQADSGSGLLIRSTPSPARLDCTVHFQHFVVANAPVRSARHAVGIVRDFRGERPDCIYGKFDPIISEHPVCHRSDTVAGVRVSAVHSVGESYNHNVRLGPTRSDNAGNVLIHFRRVPVGRDAGCWYYVHSTGRWHVETVAQAPVRPTIGPTPLTPQAGVPTLPGPGYRQCDAELRSLLLAQSSGAPLDVAGSVLQVETGLGQCSLGWRPVVSEAQVSPACPALETGRYSSGALIIHWSDPPHDGSSCWIYDPSVARWNTR